MQCTHQRNTDAAQHQIEITHLHIGGFNSERVYCVHAPRALKGHLPTSAACQPTTGI